MFCVLVKCTHYVFWEILTNSKLNMEIYHCLCRIIKLWSAEGTVFSSAGGIQYIISIKLCNAQ